MISTMRFSLLYFLVALLLGLLIYGFLDFSLSPLQLLVSENLMPDPGDYIKDVVDEYDLSLRHIGPTILPPRTWVKYSKKWEGMSLPILTVEPLGRLGNVLGEYATLYALHKIYNVSAVILPNLKQKMNCFPNLKLPQLTKTYIRDDWTSVQNIGRLYNYAPIELAAAGLLGPKRFVMKEYAFEIQLFHALREDIVQQFVFTPEIQREAKNYINTIIEKQNITASSEKGNLVNETSQTHVDTLSTNATEAVTVIGFHIRRTDYAKHAKNNFGAALPEASYFNRALDYYRQKHKHPIFIVASDDYKYVESILGYHKDVFLAPGKSPCVDMATLSLAKDNIITLGSFGFWTAYLAGGEIVYPDVKFQSVYRFSRDMYESIGLDFMTPLPVG